MSSLSRSETPGKTPMAVPGTMTAGSAIQGPSKPLGPFEGRGVAEGIGVLEPRHGAGAPANDAEQVRAKPVLAVLVDGVADGALPHERSLALGDVGRLACARAHADDGQRTVPIGGLWHRSGVAGSYQCRKPCLGLP